MNSLHEAMLKNIKFMGGFAPIAYDLVDVEKRVLTALHNDGLIRLDKRWNATLTTKGLNYDRHRE